MNEVQIKDVMFYAMEITFPISQTSAPRSKLPVAFPASPEARSGHSWHQSLLIDGRGHSCYLINLNYGHLCLIP